MKLSSWGNLYLDEKYKYDILKKENFVNSSLESGIFCGFIVGLIMSMHRLIFKNNIVNQKDDDDDFQTVFG